MRDAPHEFFGAVVMDDRLRDDAPEPGHARREPRGHVTAVERERRAAGSGHGYEA